LCPSDPAATWLNLTQSDAFFMVSPEADEGRRSSALGGEAGLYFFSDLMRRLLTKSAIVLR